jgi:hypothetical protein
MTANEEPLDSEEQQHQPLDLLEKYDRPIVSIPMSATVIGIIIAFWVVHIVLSRKYGTNKVSLIFMGLGTVLMFHNFRDTDSDGYLWGARFLQLGFGIFLFPLFPLLLASFFGGGAADQQPPRYGDYGVREPSRSRSRSVSRMRESRGPASLIQSR